VSQTKKLIKKRESNKKVQTSAMHADVRSFLTKITVHNNKISQIPIVVIYTTYKQHIFAMLKKNLTVHKSSQAGTILQKYQPADVVSKQMESYHQQ